MEIRPEIRTDSLQMLNIVKKASCTTERRLTIYISTARESCIRDEISNVGMIISKHYIAHGLTKRIAN